MEVEEAAELVVAHEARHKQMYFIWKCQRALETPIGGGGVRWQTCVRLSLRHLSPNPTEVAHFNAVRASLSVASHVSWLQKLII